MNCAVLNTSFAKISGVVGKSRLAEALAGENNFDNGLAERLLETLKDMQALQNEIAVPIAWGEVDIVQTALLIRRVARIASELNIENAGLQQSAANATGQVTNNQ